MSAMKDVQAARLVLQTRNASLRMTARATPAGLLAIGGLLCGILRDRHRLPGVAGVSNTLIRVPQQASRAGEMSSCGRPNR